MRFAQVLIVVSFLALLIQPVAHAQSSAARPPFRYGIIAGNSNTYSKVSALGFGWIKTYISWNDVEATKGTFDYSHYDNTITQARANNLRVIALIWWPPSWAAEPGASTPYYDPPRNPNDLGDFMSHLAAHYHGQIDAYEIWNEENVGDTWGGLNPDPSRYTAMLKAAYPAVKAADPNALVVSGGVANDGAGNGAYAIGDLVYLQDILQDGAGSYVDAIGIHPYPGACAPAVTSCDAPPGTYFRRAEDEHNTVVQYGGANLPLWITEAGYFSQPGAIDPNAAGCNGTNGLGGFTAYEVDETTKANDLVAAYQYAYNNWPWLGGFILMSLDLSSPASGYATCDPVRFWAILRSDGTPTQAYTALQQMTKDAPAVTFNFSNALTQASGTITISGNYTDPTSGNGSAIDDVIACVDAPYDLATQFAPATFSGNGTFQVSVDTSHLSAYVTHLVYVYVHTPSGGWTVGSIGIIPQLEVGVTPSPLSFWVSQVSGGQASAVLTLTRNDGNSAGFGWQASSDRSWLTVTRPPNQTVVPFTLDVAVDAASLQPGVYNATITLTGDSPFTNLPLKVPVTVTVTAGPPHQIFIPSVLNSPPAGL